MIGEIVEAVEIVEGVGGWRSGPPGLEVGGKGQTTEGRRQRTERNQKSEVGGRRQRTDGRGQTTAPRLRAEQASSKKHLTA